MKTTKKLFSLLMTIVLVLSSISISTAFAATKWPAEKNIKTYVLSTKNDTKVYKSATSTDGSYGTIYATDLITINSYDSSSKRINVTYPVSSGTKKGWIPLTAVTKGTWNSATGTFTATKKITTYRRASTSNEFGYVSKNDKCYKITTSGDYTQIIYPISGGYKMGWVKTSDIPSSNSTLASPVPSGCYFSQKSNDNGWYGYHDINKNVSTSTPVYAIADGTAEFRQTYYTKDGKKYLISYGNNIKFTSSDGTYTSVYAHLSKFNNVTLTIPSDQTKQLSSSSVSGAKTTTLKTKTVKKGDLLGYIGKTGNASGVHLHFELRKKGSRIDPTSAISGLVK